MVFFSIQIVTIFYTFLYDSRLHVTCGGHVRGQEKKHFSPLGTKCYFHVNSSRKSAIVFTPNMAALSRGCKMSVTSKFFFFGLSFHLWVFFKLQPINFRL